ncbi:hypothetical protein [Burkholderia pyrrocinia]
MDHQRKQGDQMSELTLPTAPDVDTMPYDSVLTLLRNTGCIKRGADPAAYVTSFQAIVHALLRQHLEPAACVLAIAAYDAGLQAGLNDAAWTPEAAQGVGPIGRGISKQMVVMVNRAGYTHGSAIRREYH